MNSSRHAILDAKNRCRRPARPPRGAGFTLVELLVTVAIIGLLLSILLPSLGRARDQAKLVACRTHLRNFCTGAVMYASDNDGALPVDTMLGPAYEDVRNPHSGLFAALAGYVDGVQNYYCPSETKPELCYSNENFDSGIMGYFYYSCEQATGNRNISTFLRWDVKWPRRLRTTMHPEKWVVSDSWFRGQRTPHSWFHKGVNYATLDTAVQMLRRSPRLKFK